MSEPLFPDDPDLEAEMEARLSTVEYTHGRAEQGLAGDDFYEAVEEQIVVFDHVPIDVRIEVLERLAQDLRSAYTPDDDPPAI